MAALPAMIADVATSDCQKKLTPETTTSSRQQELMQYQNEVAGYNYELKAAKEKKAEAVFFHVGVHELRIPGCCQEKTRF